MTESVVLNESPVIVVAQAEVRVRQDRRGKCECANSAAFRNCGKSRCSCSERHSRCARFLAIARAHQQIQRLGMIREQIRRDVRTDVSGATRSGRWPRCLGVRAPAGLRPSAPAALASLRCRERHAAPRASFRRAAFDQRIAPLAQRRNVDVDPIVPPIERARVVAEIGAFVGGQSRAQPLHVRGLEDVVVVKNEWLEKRDRA